MKRLDTTTTVVRILKKKRNVY